MGGSNQGTCPPPAATSQKPSSVSPDQFGSIRFHENQGEAHFHDDAAKIKCAIPKLDFDRAYIDWRAGAGGPLMMLGTDGKGVNTTVQFHMYPSGGKMEVGMIVAKATFGKTLQDLDVLAGI